MSLKAFHILFIIASLALAFGFGAWAFNSYYHDGPRNHLVWGALSVAVGIGLLFYGRYVLKKLKKISYL